MPTCSQMRQLVHKHVLDETLGHICQFKVKPDPPSCRRARTPPRFHHAKADIRGLATNNRRPPRKSSSQILTQKASGLQAFLTRPLIRLILALVLYGRIFCKRCLDPRTMRSNKPHQQHRRRSAWRRHLRMRNSTRLVRPFNTQINIAHILADQFNFISR